ncbi:peroxiredoxin-like family protein [Sphingorhabdus sp. Alg239-R122]|uniref:peroxiredoxin-like family protein n=1 Tax=Sphingorhabdus sp. Alg239-R122 TaxID=2305989 RepID=UPI0013DA9864|nr:peroxiredoxin-like family protein [Sphingorhabdus sp. Alg239-R122]
MSHTLPGTPVPDLKIPLVGGGAFDLSQSKPENFTLLLFYRGLHCPVCKGQLRDLQNNLDALAERGVNAVAISMDNEERATKAQQDWGVDRLAIGHSLSEVEARSFGLFLSNGINDNEPELFSEPGLFLVRPDGTLYFGSIQTMPFTRPSLKELMMGIDYALEHDYPARGEVAAQ